MNSRDSGDSGSRQGAPNVAWSFHASEVQRRIGPESPCPFGLRRDGSTFCVARLAFGATKGCAARLESAAIAPATRAHSEALCRCLNNRNREVLI